MSTKEQHLFMESLCSYFSAFTFRKIFLPAFIVLSLLGLSWTVRQLSFETCGIQQNNPATVGTAVTFTIACTSDPLPRVAWDFGDGTGLGPYGEHTTISHTFQSTGTFIVFARIEGQDAPLSTVQTIVDPITASKPTNSSTILLDASNRIVWNINADNNTVSAIDEATLTKLFEVPVGIHPRTIALQNNGDVWVANEDNATLTVLSKSGTLVRTVNLPYASRPFGVCLDPQSSAVFVTLNGTGKLLKLNPATGQIIGELPVGASPKGIAISHDGTRVFVTRFISPVDRGEITEVNAQTMAITRVIPLAFDNASDFEDKGRGVPNYISAITISPTGKIALIPSKKDNVARGKFRDGLALTFENTVRTITSRINLQTNQEELAARVDINDADMANAVAFSPYGNLAFVALQGNNKIHIREVQSNAVIGEIKETGLAPQGLVFSADGSKLFVQNFMSRTIRVYDTKDMILGKGFSASVLATVNVVATEKLSASVLKGKQIFYNAGDERMSKSGYISCASCHADGGSDQRVWDFTDRGEGLRKTIPLNGRRGTGMGNVHWTGNFDEIQDFENDMRNGFGGKGFMTDADFNATQDPLGAKKAGRSADLDALVSYVNSLNKVHPSPYTNADGSLTAEAVSGRTVFNNLGCGTCHAGSDFTDRKTSTLHDVGTILPSSGKRRNETLTGFMTPTLKGIWGTAPYLHDGSAATIRDVLTTKNTSGKHGNTASLSTTQMNQLVAYLTQLDDVNACTDQTIAFPAVPDKFTNSPAFNLTATASSGLAVSYSVLSGPATVSGNTITLTGATGTVIVAANQSGNATYCGASQVTTSFLVSMECGGVTTGTYKLINKGTGKALDNNGSILNNTFIVQRSDNAASNTNQQWTISPAGNGYFKVINRTSGKALDNSGATTTNAKMIQNTDNAASNVNQQWSICKLANGAYKLVSVKSNLVLDNSGGATAEANSIVQWTDNAASAANQQWDILPVTENTFASGVYKVTARHSGKSLNVASASTADAALIDQADYTGATNQKWKIEHVGKGYFTITASHSEKSLQLPDSSQADNAFIFQRINSKKDHQQWIVRDVGNGYFEFVAKHSGKTMAVAGGNTANGARIVQLGTGGAQHQQWKLERLEVPAGPGLGNLQYNTNEVFKNIWLYTDPTHYGSNIAIMHNGYLVTTYTPDSGRPPGGLMIWNVSNPRAPVLVKKIFDQRTSTLREAHSIGQFGNYIALQEGCGFQIWDLSDVQNPILVKRFCIPGYDHDDYGSAWQLFWQAPYIYVGNGAQGFDVVDVTDVRNPVFVKHTNVGMQAGPIFAIGNLLVTASHDIGKGYAISDISDPKNPKLLNTFTNTKNMYSSFVNGNRMIGSSRFSSNDDAFSVYDFADPLNIKFAGEADIQVSGQLYCSTQDQFIFQGCEKEIVKVDATNVAQMKVVGRGSLNITGDSDHGQVTPMGNLVFVGNDHGTGSGFIVHQQSPDTKGPQVNMINPATGSVNRALTSRVGMTLTDNVDLRTVNNTTFVVRPKGGAALTGIYTHQFSILNFSPDQPLMPNTTYEIILPAGGIKDWSGNAIPTTFTSTFSTGSTIVTCTPSAITPYLQVNGGSWQNTTNATVTSGSNITFGPHPTTGGSWNWTGPNGFSSTIREATVSNLQSNMAGNYVAVHTNAEGCTSQVAFVVTVTGNQLPSVNITSPANNAAFTAPASVTIAANATDSDGSISKVEFYNGATKLGEDATSPYSFTWTNVAAGTYSLTARATDNLGATATSSAISVSVKNPNQLPTATVTAPANGATYNAPAAITISATAADADGSITKVEFYNGATKLGDDATAPYSFTWTNVSGGTYSITVRASDNSGGVGTSAAVSVTVKSPTNTVATVYEHCNYDVTGYSVALEPGNYTRAQLIARGVKDNDISSLKVQSGYEVVLYINDNFQGTTKTFKIDDPCLVNDALNDVVTSLRIRAVTNTPPTVSITSPANNATFTAPASVTISATATDAGGSVTKVEFYNGTTKLGEDASSPYSFAWSNVGAGSYSLTARATDNSGAVTTSSVIIITVNNPVNQLPTISITSPANNATFTAPASVTINATAVDADGSVSKVEFYNGSNKLGEDLNTPYSFAWSNVGAGSYSLTARATDNSGAVTTSSVISITVNNPVNQLPTVSITSPANNATFTTPASVTINATASDADGSVSKVEFYNGSNKLGEDLSTPYSFAWNNVTAGTYSLTARATDNSGAVTTSSVISITVNNPVNQLPTVSITSPANNATFAAPASVTINATAADADGSVSKVEFYNGSNKLGEDLSTPYSFAWSNVGAGSYSLTARATDNSGGVTTSSAINITVTTVADGCSTLSTYQENSGYVAGSKVKNLGRQFECKEWPYSGWCNGAAWAYAPGDGMYWQDAWYDRGACASSASIASITSEMTTVQLQPNPTSNFIELRWNNSETETIQIEVLDMLGNVVLQENDVRYGEYLYLTSLSGGIYNMKITIGEEVQWRRIVKQ